MQQNSGENQNISYYLYGLQVLDISDPADMRLAAYYDTYDGETDYIYTGAWGAYPFFGSDQVIVSDRVSGLYVVDVFNDGEFDFGDVDFSGTVNIQDIILLVSFVLGVETPSDYEFYLSDFNGDSNIDVIDIISVIDTILN